MNILDDLKLQYKTGGIVQKLIFWNIGVAIVFFLMRSFLPLFFDKGIQLFSLPSPWHAALLQPWSFITYSFLHADIWHLVFNMIVLNFASRLFLTYFTQKQFFGVYLMGGMFAGAVFVISGLLFKDATILVGASGAIMAILIAAATYSPFSEIRLLLVGTVKLWHIALVLLILDLIQIPLQNTGGHLAHLGGSLFGFMYIRTLQSGYDLSRWISVSQEWIKSKFQPKQKTPFTKIHKNPTVKTTVAKPSYNANKSMTQKQIDDILDKISKSGYDSLSKEEKEFLFKVGKE